MDNKSETITPNEINKFSYCPYQWYYERFYGKKLLKFKLKERNQRLGLIDTRASKFVAGNEHHANVHSYYKKEMVYLRMLFIVLFILAVIIFFKVILALI